MEATVCPWHRVTHANRSITVYTRGAAFLDDEYRADESLARLITETVARVPAQQAFDAAKELVRKLNGYWAIVIQAPDGQTLAAVDRLRSIPLFYARDRAGDLVVAPSIDNLADCVDAKSIDPEAELEFLLAGFVTGDRTLFRGIRQLQPGEMIHWANGSLARTRYYRFLREGWSHASANELMVELERVLHRVFSRLVKAFAGQQVIVPLSAGLDSRLVAALLKVHGHPDVLALTYGRPGNHESEISRQVAQALGIRWEFHPYGDGDWHGLMASDEMQEFLRSAGQASSLPHVQDYLAFYKLKSKVPGLSATVFPGMVGDLIAGAWTPAQFTRNEAAVNIRAVRNWVLFRKFSNFPCSRRTNLQMKGRLEQFFDDAPLTNVHNSAGAFDLWEFENRAARYLVNSVRVYEFHKLGWWLPLCDNEIMAFFLTVRTELRELKQLYARWMHDRLFTGPLAQLARIPPEGDGRCVWYGEPRRFPAGFRPAFARGLRLALGAAIDRWMPRSLKLKKLEIHLKRHGPHPLGFHEWFAPSDAEAATRTVGDLLREPSGAFQGLSPALTEILSISADRPICLASPLGLLAAAFLADLRVREFPAPNSVIARGVRFG